MPSSCCPRRVARCGSTSSTAQELDGARPTRSKHDAIRATVDPTTRGELGAVTTAGRLIRFSPVDLPSVPPASVQLAAGVRSCATTSGSPTRASASSRSSGSTTRRPIALGTRQGVVKRVVPLDAAAQARHRDHRPQARRRGRRRRAGAGRRRARLRHERRAAAALRRGVGAPAGRARGRHGRHQPVGEGAAWSSSAAVHGERRRRRHDRRAPRRLPGTDPGRIKVSRFAEFPAQGSRDRRRARAAFLKGEDRLTLAWVGSAHARAVGPDGAARQLPEATAKRDASGQPLDAVIGSIGGTLV